MHPALGFQESQRILSDPYPALPLLGMMPALHMGAPAAHLVVFLDAVRGP